MNLSELPASQPGRPKHGLPGYGAWRWGTTHAPVLVFTGIYSVACLTGAILYLAEARLFIQLTEYFTGSKLPTLTTSQEGIDLLLLLAGPAFLWIGYELALRVPRRRVPGAGYVARRLGSLQLQTPVWLPTVVFLCSALLALGAIAGSGAKGQLSSWLNYSAGIHARERLLQNVSFFGFVDIYTIVPLTAAWVMITVTASDLRGVLLRGGPVLVTVFVDLLLFQKRSAIASLLIIFFAWLAAGEFRFTRRRAQLALAGVCAVVAVYFVGVIAPAKAHGKLCGIQNITCDVITRNVPPVVLYTAMAPFTRASVPALYYPVIYPAHHAFYGPDFGQDIVGIGQYPDDNLVVWHYINGGTAGNTAVPFQFTLYSEDGIVGALLASSLIGAALALGWRLRRRLPRAWSGLLGSMVLIFAAFLAEDSLRNSLLVSYGVIYGLLFLAVMAFAVHMFNVGAQGTRVRSRTHRESMSRV